MSTYTRNLKTFCPAKSDPDWRYLAGLWDGEGCVSAACQKRKRADGSKYSYWQFRLILSNTSLRLIESLGAEYGGRVYSYKSSPSPKHKVAHQWIVFNAAECLYILKNILPFLRYKDEEAKIAIEYMEGMADNRFGGGRGIPNSEIDRRNRLIVAMRSVEGRRCFPRSADVTIDYRPRGVA